MLRKLRAFVTSLRTRILLIVLLCWLLPVLTLGGYMGTVFFSALREKTEAAFSLGAEHAHSLTLQIVQRAVTLAKDVTYDGELASTASVYGAGKLSFPDFYRISRNYLERKFGRETLFTFAAYFPPERPGEFMYTAAGHPGALKFKAEYQALALQMGETLDTRCGFTGWGEGLYLVRNLYNLRMERFGMLVLGINAAELFAPLLSPGQMWGGRFDVKLDSYARYRDDAVAWDGEAQGLSEEKDALSYAQASVQRDFSLLTRVQVDKRTVYAQMTQFTRLLVFLALAIVPVGVTIMWFVHRRIIKPILLLSRASRRMADGELGVTVPMRGRDELGQLGLSFSNMSTRIQHLVDTVYKEEIALRDARIRALQSRVNPHFLNNALETISWQARMDGSETVSAMVEALSVLLNASLDRGEQRTVALSEELAVADAYIYFVRLRFGGKLSVDRDVDPSLLAFPLPRMVVQTLLENAVEHGVAPAGGGHIRLRVFREGPNLVVQVANGGRQLSEDDLQRISALLSGDLPGEGHVGIRNVSQRLKLIYGTQAGLDIGRDGQGDTVARISIPFQRVTAQAETTNHKEGQ